MVISKLRSVRLFLLSAILASLMFSSTAYAACAAYRIVIENTWYGDGVTRVHYMELIGEGDGYCVYGGS